MRQNKLDTKSISIRIPYKTLKALQYIADYEGRSMNSQVLYLIRSSGEVGKGETSQGRAAGAQCRHNRWHYILAAQNKKTDGTEIGQRMESRCGAASVGRSTKGLTNLNLGDIMIVSIIVICLWESLYCRRPFFNLAAHVFS